MAEVILYIIIALVILFVYFRIGLYILNGFSKSIAWETGDIMYIGFAGVCATFWPIWFCCLICFRIGEWWKKRQSSEQIIN